MASKMFQYVVPEFDLGYRLNFNPRARNTIPKKRTKRDVCIVMKFPGIKSPGVIHKHVIFLCANSKDDAVYERIRESQKKGYTAYLIRVYSNLKSKSPQFAPMFLPTKSGRPAYLKYTGLKTCLEQIILNPATEKYIIYFDSTRFVYALKDCNAYHFDLMQPLTIHPTRLTDCLLDIPSKCLNESEVLLTFNTVHPTLPMKSIIEELPSEDNYILFSAIGTYDPSMQNEIVLRTFIEFARKYGENLHKTLVLVFGGIYDPEEDFVNYYNIKNTYNNSAEYANTLVYFARDFLPLEIRAILKKATMMIDFSCSWDERPICQNALKYATPIVAGMDSSSKDLVIDGENGYVLETEDIDFNTSMMRLCIEENERLSLNARKSYSKKFSKLAITLAEFQNEDNLLELDNDID